MTKPDAAPLSRPALPAQILTIIFYGGFATAVSITAMAMFGPIGLLIAVFFAWQWGRIPTLTGGAAADDLAAFRPQVPDAPATSGNASFDAYRADMLTRLEAEQTQFQGFLSRLRDAQDKAEFDGFMAEQADPSRRVTA